MNPAEAKATQLVKELYEHCRANKLPVLAIAGLVQENKLAKVWTELEGDSLRMFQVSVIEALWRGEHAGMMRTNTPTLHRCFMLWAASVFGPSWQTDVPRDEMKEREKAYISGMLGMHAQHAQFAKMPMPDGLKYLKQLEREFHSYFMDMPLREEGENQNARNN